LLHQLSYAPNDFLVRLSMTLVSALAC